MYYVLFFVFIFLSFFFLLNGNAKYCFIVQSIWIDVHNCTDNMIVHLSGFLQNTTIKTNKKPSRGSKSSHAIQNKNLLLAGHKL